MQRDKSKNRVIPDNSETNNMTDAIVDTVMLTYSSANRVDFSVNAGQPGFLVYSQPYTKGWRSRVDGKRADVQRAEGYLPAVYVSAGRHIVEFRYTSLPASIGMAISLFVMAGIGVYCALLLLRARGWRQIGLFTAIVIPGLCYYLWKNSLYGGESIGTVYKWTSQQFMNKNNIAFRKPTKMSSIALSGQYPYEYYSGNGVDGSIRTAVTSDIGTKPQWWMVDLGDEYPLASLVIFGFPSNNIYPLRVLGSTNGKYYFPVTVYKHDFARQPVRIPLYGVRARYVRIVSLNTDLPIAFKEIAVFPVKPVVKRQ